jgi:molecular chaperone DnaJ
LPVGIAHGETIRYAHLGDDSIPGVPPGSLNVTVVVLPDNNYQRVGDDLYTSVEINSIEAMIGCSKTVKMITGKEMTLNIRAGVESGAEFASGGHGFTNTQTQRKGRFVSVVKIKTLQIIDPAIIARLKQLNDDISS